MKNSLFKLVYRLVLCAECAYGLYLNIFANQAGFMNTGVLRYYTIQSNILVLLVTLVSAAASARELASKRAPGGAFYRGLRFATATAITLTFCVFWLMLTGGYSFANLMNFPNLAVHGITPILFVIDFLFFDRAERMKMKEIFPSCIAPVLYFAFSLIYAEVARPAPLYPYWFIDLTQIGWFGKGQGLGVFHWCVIIIASMLLLSLFYRAVYNRGRRAKN